MYSSCAHRKQNFCYKSECFWTNRTVAPRRSKRFSENTHNFSFDSWDKTQISVTYKAVIMCNNNEMCIDQKTHVSNYAL